MDGTDSVTPALQRRNLLFFGQEGPKKAKRIEPKKTKEDAKKQRTRASPPRPFFRFFSFFSALPWSGCGRRPRCAGRGPGRHGRFLDSRLRGKDSPALGRGQRGRLLPYPGWEGLLRQTRQRIWAHSAGVSGWIHPAPPIPANAQGDRIFYRAARSILPSAASIMPLRRSWRMADSMLDSSVPESTARRCEVGTLGHGCSV